MGRWETLRVDWSNYHPQRSEWDTYLYDKLKSTTPLLHHLSLSWYSTMEGMDTLPDTPNLRSLSWEMGPTLPDRIWSNLRSLRMNGWIIGFENVLPVITNLRTFHLVHLEEDDPDDVWTEEPTFPFLATLCISAIMQFYPIQFIRSPALARLVMAWRPGHFGSSDLRRFSPGLSGRCTIVRELIVSNMNLTAEEWRVFLGGMSTLRRLHGYICHNLLESVQGAWPETETPHISIDEHKISEAEVGGEVLDSHKYLSLAAVREIVTNPDDFDL